MVVTLTRILLLGAICTGDVFGFHFKASSRLTIRIDVGGNGCQRGPHDRAPLRPNTYLFHSASPFDEVLIEAASQKLGWEILEESNLRPVLDLTSRDGAAPVVDGPSSLDGGDTSEWDHGQRWAVTKRSLAGMGLDMNDDGDDEWASFLRGCPQLLRLDPSAVTETAEWVVREFGVAYLRSSPALLGFRAADAAYGMEFMSVMMMADAKPACSASGRLLEEAIRGGIHERAVGAALRSAATATSKASQSVAAEGMASYRELKANAQRKKGL